MAKHRITPRELLKRQGSFWQEGDPQTEKDMALRAKAEAQPARDS